MHLSNHIHIWNPDKWSSVLWKIHVVALVHVNSTENHGHEIFAYKTGEFYIFPASSEFSLVFSLKHPIQAKKKWLTIGANIWPPDFPSVWVNYNYKKPENLKYDPLGTVTLPKMSQWGHCNLSRSVDLWTTLKPNWCESPTLHSLTFDLRSKYNTTWVKYG